MNELIFHEGEGGCDIPNCFYHPSFGWSCQIRAKAHELWNFNEQAVQAYTEQLEMTNE